MSSSKGKKIKVSQRMPMANSDLGRTRDCLYLILTCTVLAAVTGAVYWQVTQFDFTTFDDPLYVYENPNVTAGITAKSIAWAFNIGYQGNWHPLTWLSHMLDAKLFGIKKGSGLGPGAHHLTSLMLHIANSMLLLLLLRTATGLLWPSAFVAGLFALHPQHVESVAWVSERKDVLSAFFWMLTMLVYVTYARKPSLWHYSAVVLSYGIGLTAKPMLVSLPIVLLLYDLWPLRRKWTFRLVTEKIPLIAMAVGSCVVTFLAQARGKMVSSFEVIPLGQRLANAVITVFVYLAKTLWPSKLGPYYPHPGNSWDPLLVATCLLLLVGITAGAVLWRRKYPYLMVGWLWYIVALVPVIGVIQVGLQARADRYTYIPLVGVFIVFAWAVSEVTLSLTAGLRASVAVLEVVVLAAMSYVTYGQIGYWENSEKLFRRALAVTDRNWFAQNALGGVLDEQGRHEEAIRHLETSISILPVYAPTHGNLGKAYAAMGNYESAIKHYRDALAFDPHDARTHSNLANVLFQVGKVDDAVSEYKHAIENDPNFACAYFNYSVALTELGDIDGAMEKLRKALSIDPNDYWAHNNYALLLARVGRKQEAIEHLRIAIQIDPSERAARVNLGIIAGDNDVKITRP